MRILKNGIAVPDKDQLHGVWCENEGLVHDKFIMDKLRHFIFEGMHIVDIGAHIGSHAAQYSIWTGHSGFVHCFEPNPETFECLKHNLGGIKNIRMHCVALGRKSGEAKMNPIAENMGASFLSEGVGTPVVTLDSMNLNQCDFIKIDAEGFEPDILLGAENTIKKFHPTMFIEINQGALKRNNSSVEEVFKILDNFGYNFKEITGTLPLSSEQYDIICT